MIYDGTRTHNLYVPRKTYNLYVPRKTYHLHKKQNPAANWVQYNNEKIRDNYGTDSLKSQR